MPEIPKAEAGVDTDSYSQASTDANEALHDAELPTTARYDVPGQALR